MRPVVLDPAARARIAACVAHARANPIPMAEVLRNGAEGGSGRAVGDDPRRVVDIDFGIRCVFSIEQALRYADGRFGWARHVSISVGLPGRFLHPVAVDEILPLFGFTAGVRDPQTHVYVEEFGIYGALNILQECADPVHDAREDAMIVPIPPVPSRDRSPGMEAVEGQGSPITSTEGTSHVDSDDHATDQRHQPPGEIRGG